MNKDRKKAVALVSAGLDSMLAVKVIQEQNIDVLGLCFTFSFDSVKHRERAGHIQCVREELGIPIKLIDRSVEFLQLIKDPGHGYGSKMNPCIDCRIQMFQFAKQYMEEAGAHFIISGEVVGQRPMSQHRPILYHIDKVTGLKGLILRPLCAKHLPESIPEQQGWINREQLLDLYGRGRKPQLAMAEAYGLTCFEPPAGGCSLTNPDYARRLSTLFKQRGREHVELGDMELLLCGRHFWPNEHLHVIVGRNEQDNRAIEERVSEEWIIFEPDDVPGPYTAARGVENNDDILIAASLAARYTNQRNEDHVKIKYSGPQNGSVCAQPVPENNIEAWRL